MKISEDSVHTLYTYDKRGLCKILKNMQNTGKFKQKNKKTTCNCGNLEFLANYMYSYSTSWSHNNIVPILLRPSHVSLPKPILRIHLHDVVWHSQSVVHCTMYNIPCSWESCTPVQLLVSRIRGSKTDTPVLIRLHNCHMTLSDNVND